MLAEILEPSKNLEPRYRPIEFSLGNDDPFTGFLIKEEGETLTIQTGPGEAMVKKFAKKDLTSRASSSSLMPPGLLNLLNKEQILDLLAYLKPVATRSTRPSASEENGLRLTSRSCCARG